MKGEPSRRDRDVSAYIELFEHVIGWALACGLPGDWNKVRRKLDALSIRLKADEAARGRSKAPDWAYRLERQLWIDALIQLLLPESWTASSRYFACNVRTQILSCGVRWT